VLTPEIVVRRIVRLNPSKLVIHCVQKKTPIYIFYRAMHFSAKRGIAIACRLSVCLSVCNVGEL